MVSGKWTEGETGMGRKRMVVFVCIHGSAKSVIAAEHLRRLAERQGVEMGVTSAGTEPDGKIPPHVVKGLLGDGIDIRGSRPRRVTREELTDAWRVVALGCDLGEMAPPGLTVLRWDDIPAVSEDFKVARDLIVARLPRLLAESAGSCRDSEGR